MQRRTRDPGRSKSAAVRLALLNPSRRQLSKWQREQRARLILLLTGIGITALVLGILAFGFWREAIAGGLETAAVVYGERITVNDLVAAMQPRAAALQAQIRFFERQGQAQLAQQFGFQVAQLPQQALDELIEERIIARHASTLGIAVTPDEVEAEIRKTLAEDVARSQPQPTPTATPEGAAAPTAAATPVGTPTPRPSPTPVPTLTEDQVPGAYASFLSRIGQTDAEYRAAVRKELLRQKVRAAVAASVPTHEEQVHARHILLKDEAKARELLDRLNAGARWEELVAESEDVATKDKGGDLGWFGRGAMNRQFEEAAFALQPGQRSGVVQSPNGFHIIEVLERDPNRAIEEERRESLRDRAFQEWLSAARQPPDVVEELSDEEIAWALRKLGLRRP
jgi:parvulin-like peptidyl-prolyl isomerase